MKRLLEINLIAALVCLITLAFTSTVIASPHKWDVEGDRDILTTQKRADGSILLAGEDGWYQVINADRSHGAKGQWIHGDFDIKTIALLYSGDVLLAGENGYYQILNSDNTLSEINKGQWAPAVNINASAKCSDGFVFITGDNGYYQKVDLSGNLVDSASQWTHSSSPINAANTFLSYDPLAVVFNHAVFSDGDLSLIGNSEINSSPEINNGDVGTNSNLTISGSAKICGDAFYGGTFTGSSIKVTGSKTLLSSPVELPDIDLDLWKTTASTSPTGQTIAGPINYNGGNHTFTQCLIDGDLSLSGNCTFEISGIIWITGDVKLSGQSKIIGNGTIVSEGTIDLRGGSSYSPSLDTNIGFISLSSSPTAISVLGNADIQCILYAPDGGISVGGSGNIYGAIVADTISLTGTADIFYYTNLVDNPIPLPFGNAAENIMFGGADGKYQVFTYDIGTLTPRTSGVWTIEDNAIDIKAITPSTFSSGYRAVIGGEGGNYTFLDDNGNIVLDSGDVWKDKNDTQIINDINALFKLKQDRVAFGGSDGYYNVNYIDDINVGTARLWPYTVDSNIVHIYSISQLNQANGGYILTAGSDGYYWWVDIPIIESFTDRITAFNNWIGDDLTLIQKYNQYIPKEEILSRLIINPAREDVTDYTVTIYLDLDNSAIDPDLTSFKISYKAKSGLTAPISLTTTDNGYGKYDILSETINGYTVYKLRLTFKAPDVNPDPQQRVLIYLKYKFNRISELTSIGIKNKAFVKTFLSGYIEERFGEPMNNPIFIRKVDKITYE